MKAAAVTPSFLRSIQLFALFALLAPAGAAAQSCVTVREPCALRNEAHPPRTINSLGMKLLLVGGPDAPVYIGGEVVTARFFSEVMDGADGGRDPSAIVLVSADEAIEFCRRLSRLTEQSYRLPSLSETMLFPDDEPERPEWIEGERGPVLHPIHTPRTSTAAFRVVRPAG